MCKKYVCFSDPKSLKLIVFEEGNKIAEIPFIDIKEECKSILYYFHITGALEEYNKYTRIDFEEVEE